MREDPARHLRRHLDRTATVTTDVIGVRILSEDSGMTRLELREVRLSSNSAASIIGPNAGETFIYVLAGQGTLTQGGEKIDIGEGDFIGLSAGDEVAVHNPFDPDLVFLSGGEKT